MLELTEDGVNEKILGALFAIYRENDIDFNFVRHVTYEDQKGEREKLEKLMEKHRFDIDDQNLLKLDIICSMNDYCEKNGFINGLKLGARLMLELTEDDRAAVEEKEKCS